MCRLLGYATSTERTLADLLGEAELREFTELSCKHGDGWGVARATDGAVEVDKAPDAARLSEHFARVAHGYPADLAMVHLRWATLGLPVASRNAHPFTDGRLAFAHNGSVSPPSTLERLVSDGVRPLRRGDTDSELLFLAVLSRLAAADPDADADPEVDPVALAYAATIRTVADQLTYSSLNSMLVTPNRLYAVCRYDPAAEEREAEPEYYRLRYRVTPGAVVVSSSGWGSGWAELENGQLLVVDRGTLATSVRPLEPSPVGC